MKRRRTREMKNKRKEQDRHQKECRGKKEKKLTQERQQKALKIQIKTEKVRNRSPRIQNYPHNLCSHSHPQMPQWTKKRMKKQKICSNSSRYKMACHAHLHVERSCARARDHRAPCLRNAHVFRIVVQKVDLFHLF